MTNILYEPFPEAITAAGQEFAVLTDFREWLRFADLIADKEIPAEEKAYLCSMWLDPEPETITEEIIHKVIAFYRADELFYKREADDGAEEAEPAAPSPPLFDWCMDARFLLGDFRRYYRIDLLTIPHLHWWEFLSLFTALPEESSCMKRIAYRGADLSQIKDKRERSRIAKIQKQIALPFTFDDEMIGETLWNIR